MSNDYLAHQALIQSTEPQPEACDDLMNERKPIRFHTEKRTAEVKLADVNDASTWELV